MPPEGERKNPATDWQRDLGKPPSSSETPFPQLYMRALEYLRPRSLQVITYEEMGLIIPCYCSHYGGNTFHFET